MAGATVPSCTSDNCLLSKRWHHRWDLSSIQSANTEFLLTHSQQQVQILTPGKKNKKKQQGAFTDAEIFHRCELNTEAAEESHYRRRTWKVREEKM